ncbi:hypothetical protein KEM55_006300 [Ascosphaera atra]|nr:hypothetical protein KEM55_006300 [Ascosphaera atra]
MFFKPIHFVPASPKDAILATPVLSVRVVAHEHEPGAKTNHWCFYLRTGGDQAVAVDCIPSYMIPSTVLTGGSKGNVIVSELASEVPEGAVKVCELGLRSPVTVGDIINLLVDNGRHKYEFNDQGVGCRFWVTDQLELFKEKGFIAASSEIDTTEAAILKLWPEETPNPLDQGAYY